MKTAAVLRLLLGAVGAAVLAYGVLGLLSAAPATAPVSTGLWLVGGVLAHDLVLAPVVAGVGWLLVRLVPDWARPVVQGGLVVAAVLVLVALPAVLRQGAPGGYASLLPQDYRTNLTGLLLAVLAGTAALVALRGVRQRRSRVRNRRDPADQSATS